MPSSWDAMVVGAGPAGCLAAERLTSRGLRVLVVDAGPRQRESARVVEVDRRVWGYTTVGGSFDWTRVRAVGGRSLVWGGWCCRFPEVVLRRGGFPWGAAALAPLYDALEQRLGVVEGSVDERYRAAARALDVTIAPKRGPVARGGRVWSALRTNTAARARTYTAALRLDHAHGRAGAVSLFDLRDGKTKQRRARAFILAASPIETARVLLESELGASAGRVGRGLVDHMVASFILLEPRPAPPPRGRLPLSGCAVVESFVNTSARTRRPYRGGFSMEISGPLPLETFGIERMVPGDETDRWSVTQIHSLGELFPDRRRFVDLDPERRDALGRRVPRVHTGWSRADERLATDMKKACVRFADELAVPGSRLIPLVDPLLFGAGHEAGTCVMGEDEGAPCDPQGRLRALDNVWIADASALPTAGDRHPTLTVLAHALRAADAAAEYLCGEG